MRRLVVIEGKADPAEIETEREIHIGRAREADLRLFDETASRRHARIHEAEGRTLLEDLGSANGVYLNEERLEGPAALFDGDVIRIGGVRLRYLSGEGADRATRAVERESVEAVVDPDEADPAAEAGGAAARRRLRLVCDAAAACADAADARTVLGTLLDLVVEAFGPDRATVVLVSGTGGGGADEVAAAAPEGASPPNSATLRERVREQGEAVLVRDALDSTVRREAASIVASRFRSTLAAPLKTAEGVLGYVVVEAEEPSRYAELDLAALAAVARQAGLALRNLRVLSSARAEARRLADRVRDGAPRLLGEAPSLAEVRSRIAKAARVDTPVLVTGETGTGKELVARQLHALGPRQNQHFVALNCAAIVEGLLESELFGHEKGAFTGAVDARRGRIAEAGKGTLFLDEIGDLPLPLQAKLLRILSEGTYTRVGGTKVHRMACRVVAATNRDLKALAEDGAFRSDLYYRLAVLEIRLPALRNREGDVLLLAEAGLERLAARLGRRVPRLAADAREVLEGYPWPGNVRELMNVLERVLVLTEGDTIHAADLPAELRAVHAVGGTATDGPDEVLTLKEAERRAVMAALRASGGRKGRAAELLGTSWPTLNRKIRQYDIDVSDLGETPPTP